LVAIPKSPDRADARRNLIAKQLADQIFLAFVAGCQNDQIGGKLFFAPPLHSITNERCAGLEYCYPHLAFDDQIRTADVEIITAAASQIFELPTRTIFSEIKFEAFALEPIEQVLVQILCLLREQDVTSFCDCERDGSRD